MGKKSLPIYTTYLSELALSTCRQEPVPKWNPQFSSWRGQIHYAEIPPPPERAPYFRVLRSPVPVRLIGRLLPFFSGRKAVNANFRHLSRCHRAHINSVRREPLDSPLICISRALAQNMAAVVLRRGGEGGGVLRGFYNSSQTPERGNSNPGPISSAVLQHVPSCTVPSLIFARSTRGAVVVVWATFETSQSSPQGLTFTVMVLTVGI